MLSLLQKDYTSADAYNPPEYGSEFLILMVVLLIWFTTSVFFSIWVYKDAQKRVHNENLWIIFVMLTGIVGLLIYFFFREEEISIEEELDNEIKSESL
jgi:hypothetical protein